MKPRARTGGGARPGMGKPCRKREAARGKAVAKRAFAAPCRQIGSPRFAQRVGRPTLAPSQRFRMHAHKG
ncbi:hypothetical protein GCM10009654_22480 [Streptomyces hebeiensis]|uniref:Uncharacterized protein n=1 Tax=Streptomyces hebeiensis TaxID=229486 RepID=A0ABN1URT9_9ACTN